MSSANQAEILAAGRRAVELVGWRGYAPLLRRGEFYGLAAGTTGFAFPKWCRHEESDPGSLLTKEVP